MNPLRICLLLLLALPPAVGAQAIDLYEGEAPVEGQSEGERRAAAPRALSEVLVKLTGDDAAPSHPALAELVANAASLIQQYRYREDARIVDGVPQRRTTLIARFSSDAVNARVLEAGLPLWPEPRPPVTVWLGIDDGSGARLVSSAQAGAVGALTAQAGKRGVELVFPLLDLEDQNNLDVQDVWREDVTVIRDASVRYGGSAVLSGRLRRDGGGWASSWVVIDGDEVLERWSASDPRAEVALAAGADGAARALAQRYAGYIASGSAGSHAVVVSGIRSAADYARMMQYLRGLALVRDVQVASASDDRLHLVLDLASSIESLERMLAVSRVLTPAGRDIGSPDPVYQLEP